MPVLRFYFDKPLVGEIISQIDQEKSLKVQRAIDLLDNNSMKYISMAVMGKFVGPDPKTMGEALISITNFAALSHLQQLGILRAFQIYGEEIIGFELTNFGRAVAKALGL